MQAIQVHRRGSIDKLIQGTNFSHALFILESMHKNRLSEDKKYLKYLLGNYYNLQISQGVDSIVYFSGNTFQRGHQQGR
jgi:hypothetical protein